MLEPFKAIQDHRSGSGFVFVYVFKISEESNRLVVLNNHQVISCPYSSLCTTTTHSQMNIFFHGKKQKNPAELVKSLKETLQSVAANPKNLEKVSDKYNCSIHIETEVQMILI